MALVSFMTLLLLWDIDGTLLSSGGAGMRALQAGLTNAFGINGLLEDIEFAGRTDRWIMRQIFLKFDLPASETNFARYIEAYLAALPAAMADGPARVLPGARDLVAAAAIRSGVAQGLLTGNLRRGAQVKLGFHGFWEPFAFGAFGDDAELRNELGPYALRRARERHGQEFLPHQVWVIGDTPHDIACARAIGANSLALATGQHSLAALQAHAPTAALPDLQDADRFWRHVSG
jgi:phosphoglycolate phosphatase